jgi:glycosyltransferase involved in cell wall biosynthesis
MALMRPRVLTIVHGFPPAFRGGGPLQSVSALVQLLGDRCRFVVFTRGNDKGHEMPVPKDRFVRWNRKGVVRYSSRDWRLLASLVLVAGRHRPDVLYLNSLFEPRLTLAVLLALKLGLFPRPPELVLAPRGSFSPGALVIRGRKKSLFLALARAIGLYRGVTWHATSELEATQIREHFGPHVTVRLSPNVPALGGLRSSSAVPDRGEVDHDPIRLVFLSRVSEKKNLLGAIEVLRRVSVPAIYDIFGPIEGSADLAYWNRCLQALASLPAHIQVTHRGAIPHAQVAETLSRYDGFFLPTAGENFGHVFVEALLAGVPVITSDQTPWRDLREKRLGFDIPLRDFEAAARAIEDLGRMSAGERRAMREGCRRYAESVIIASRAAVLDRSPFAVLDRARDERERP